MPGPSPKPASARQRRNRVATARTLQAVHDVETPALPRKTPAWRKATREWWESIWASPMAPEYDDSDLHGLYLLAYLMDDFHDPKIDAKQRKELAAEIRQQRQCFGLTPLDRRRLQWEIDRGDEADERRRKRAADRKPKPVQGEAPPDPRQLLA